MATGSSESSKCFKRLPYNGIELVDSNCIAYRRGEMSSFNVVYSAYELTVGGTFSIKIIETDADIESQVDTAFTFGVTSCPLDEITRQGQLHCKNVCGKTCKGTHVNSVSLRRPEFKRVDSTISFIRCDTEGDSDQFIKIFVNGEFAKLMHDHSQNGILSWATTLVPFVILNGAVTAILFEKSTAIDQCLGDGAAGGVSRPPLACVASDRNGVPRTGITTPCPKCGYRQQSRAAASGSGVCRFCDFVGTGRSLVRTSVCSKADCQSNSKFACSKTLRCGHWCGGIKDERSCLPCLRGCSNVSSIKQNAGDMCVICYTEALSAAPSIQLDCGHVFHYTCCKKILQKRWSGARINFTFSQCPICKERINHSSLRDLVQPVTALFEDVKRKALLRLEYENLQRCDAIVKPGGRYHGDPLAFAMEKYAYYVCCKCHNAYFGGAAQCDAQARAAVRSSPGDNDLQLEADDAYDPNDLVCSACSVTSPAQTCTVHGNEYLEYKCRYCCSVAVFFCFGTTHFCQTCHANHMTLTRIPQQQLPSCPVGPKALKLPGSVCPLNVQHPPTGTEFALGCGLCRNTQSF